MPLTRSAGQLSYRNASRGVSSLNPAIFPGALALSNKKADLQVRFEWSSNAWIGIQAEPTPV